MRMGDGLNRESISPAGLPKTPSPCQTHQDPPPPAKAPLPPAPTRSATRGDGYPTSFVAGVRPPRAAHPLPRDARSGTASARSSGGRATAAAARRSAAPSMGGGQRSEGRPLVFT